jgi:signal transduction histidine kinase/protein-S-isoprenylcysteine O-methyltransferase Ste14
MPIISAIGSTLIGLSILVLTLGTRHRIAHYLVAGVVFSTFLGFTIAFLVNSLFLLDGFKIAHFSRIAFLPSIGFLLLSISIYLGLLHNSNASKQQKRVLIIVASTLPAVVLGLILLLASNEIRAAKIFNTVKTHLSSQLKSSSSFLYERSTSLLRMAQRVGNDRTPDIADWHADAKLYIMHNPSFIGLTWMSLDRELLAQQTTIYDEYISEIASSPTPNLRASLSVSQHTGQMSAVSAPDLPSGNNAYHLIVPILDSAHQVSGWIIATLKTETLLGLKDGPFANVTSYFVDADQSEQRSNESSRISNYNQRGELLFPGHKWLVEAKPNLEKFEELSPPLDNFILVLTVLVSLLLATLTKLFLKSIERTSALETENRARLEAESELSALNEQLEKKVTERTKSLQESRQKAISTMEEAVKARERAENAEGEVTRMNANLEWRVKQRTSELEAVNTELESFTYSVSHDLRAPLRHISGFISLLEKHSGEMLDEKGKRYISVVRDSAVKMGELIDELLAFSRTGRSEVKLDKIDMNALIANVIEELQKESEPDKISWKLETLPTVLADRTMMRQVIFNLLSNAVKYSSTRNPSRIAIGSTTSEEGEKIFFVKDNGVGFNDKYSEKVFGIFQRLHRSDEFEGNGVGLAIVHRVVLKHGGRAWAEGTINEGATFYFSLPPQRIEE